MPDKHGTWYHSYSTGPITVPTATAIFISSTVTNVNGPNPKQRIHQTILDRVIISATATAAQVQLRVGGTAILPTLMLNTATTIDLKDLNIVSTADIAVHGLVGAGTIYAQFRRSGN